ncbi:uncharacterized protein CEXT_7611 [Caerostris extrusa]|uniref:Uncharacterized protein n=1 Tax=Caerostris extrusa TaxID=172846 RepID=A0AAV4XSC1_CAEEX|nr:uncharacterized protein CEXT_7611 [Caerostris extrusa]
MASRLGPFPITRSFIPELGLIITQAISPKVPKIPGVLSTWGFLHKPVSGVVLRISTWSVQCHFLQEFLADERRRRKMKTKTLSSISKDKVCGLSRRINLLLDESHIAASESFGMCGKHASCMERAGGKRIAF